MAKAPDPFHEFVIELFAPLGAVSVRRMFGGAGVYAGGVMFALLADDMIYLKADAAFRKELAEVGCEPFLWTRPSDGRSFDLGYVSLPTDALDDPEEASRWARRALDIARAAKAAKPPPRRKKSVS
ncbi:TfoX/Sxy family protein [Hyphomonas sp.]|uniref:TfoX/Sxy family protein n=1 Tax=Hyphomonas sp. TaxID=87 RepID=UPI0039197513